MIKLRTERLILRPFGEEDLESVYKIFGDLEVNRFLPWFPVRTMDEARAFYEKRLRYEGNEKREWYYAVCLKGEHSPIGYVNLTMDDSYDLGYGFCREFWHRGFAVEAGKAVIGQMRDMGIPYVTATHDVRNPGSGKVMERLGMGYCYSYEEQWQPKDMPVTFRMYQLNLDGNEDRVYRKYWEKSAVHYVEDLGHSAEPSKAKNTLLSEHSAKF